MPKVSRTPALLVTVKTGGSEPQALDRGEMARFLGECLLDAAYGTDVAGRYRPDCLAAEVGVTVHAELEPGDRLLVMFEDGMMLYPHQLPAHLVAYGIGILQGQRPSRSGGR